MGPGQTIRFTPEELKALLDSGQLTPEVITKLNPADQRVAMNLGANIAQGPDGQLHPIRPVSDVLAGLATAIGAGVGGAGILEGVDAAGGVVPGLIKVGKSIAPYAGMLAIDQARQHGMLSSTAAQALELYYGLNGALKGGGEAAAETEAAQPNPISGGSGPTAPHLPDFGPGPNFPESSGTSPSLPNFSLRKPSNVSRVSQGEFNQVGKGEALSDIEKKIFGSAPQGAYSSNVNTQSDLDEIKQLLTGPPKGSPTPLYYHNGDPEKIRSSVDKLKRAVQRRSPQDNNDD